MDFDKLSAFVKAIGFPAAVAVWFMWNLQGYLQKMTEQQAILIELMNRLVALHHP